VATRVAGSKLVAIACMGGLGALVVAGLLPGAPSAGSSVMSSSSRGAPENSANFVQVAQAARVAMIRSVPARADSAVVPTTVATTVPTATPSSGVNVDERPAPAPVPAAPVPQVVASPGNPPADVAPSPNFVDSCSGTSYDDSAGCVNATVQAIDNARAQEGLPNMTIPGNWTSLTPQQQLFVATNLERTVRGLAPLSAMATSLDQSAQQGASADQDPSPTAGFPFTRWGANWSGGFGNPLEAMYMWMYDDGEGSANLDCTPSNPSGCWGHRDNVLLAMSCTPCVMGAGFVAQAYQGGPSMAELLVSTSGNPAVDFTWQQEEAFL